MTRPDPTGHPLAFTFLLLPRFSMLCLANAVEPLRAANQLVPEGRFSYHLASLDGQAVPSSSGIEVAVDCALGKAPPADVFFVVSSYAFRRYCTPAAKAAVRQAARRAGTVGGMDTGPWLLAAAGLLAGRRATIHWQEKDAFAEAFPDVAVATSRWVTDGNRITCGGATAVLDLMLSLVRRYAGEVVALDVMRLFIYDEERPGDGGQMPAPQASFAIRAPEVARAIVAMEDALEEPLPIAEVARRSGCSQRKLERSFATALGVTPQAYYQHLRLSAAREMLRQGGRAVAEAAIRTGFSSPTSFARAYRRRFGESPGTVKTAALESRAGIVETGGE